MRDEMSSGMTLECFRSREPRRCGSIDEPERSGSASDCKPNRGGLQRAGNELGTAGVKLAYDASFTPAVVGGFGFGGGWWV